MAAGVFESVAALVAASVPESRRGSSPAGTAAVAAAVAGDSAAE
jgi:hypothetical protein